MQAKEFEQVSSSATLPEKSQNANSVRAGRAEPIGGYMLLAFAFLGITSGGLLWVRRHKLSLPKPSVSDLVMMGLATARLSRLITRDKVMRPLRAPFAVAEREPRGEVKEHVKGQGLERAVGELITCPRCTAIWAASCLGLTFFASPGIARFANLLLSSALISDFTNRSFARLNESHSDH